jgi:hypothetical protein
MYNEKMEIRFMIDANIYNSLKEKAQEMDVPLASYVKMKLGLGGKNGKRRKKDK